MGHAWKLSTYCLGEDACPLGLNNYDPCLPGDAILTGMHRVLAREGFVILRNEIQVHSLQRSN